VDSMRTTEKILLLSFVLLLAVSGCAVPKIEYEKQRELNKRLTEECERLREENMQLRRNNEILANQLEGRRAELAAAMSLVEALRKEKETPPPTPEGEWQTNRETGGIILESGILFQPGKATLTEKGRKMVAKIAELLNSPKYAEYLVRIDGHTDDQPVVKTKKENIDNWFLSARRAHSVLSELRKCGVATERLYICAFGETRPIAPNAPGKKGNPKNRRVEILLVKPVKK